MYTVCTSQLSKAINFPQLMIIPRYFVYLAVAGWIAVTAGLISKAPFGMNLFGKRRNTR